MSLKEEDRLVVEHWTTIQQWAQTKASLDPFVVACGTGTGKYYIALFAFHGLQSFRLLVLHDQLSGLVGHLLCLHVRSP
ncbi:hypothetical protein LZ554_004341 [Drepanopeziza brunnea f. sp. 'monogermtubi']|nr:hypothetical protein LZ554_004341 [Drepanopeziza brunnea f. sp. 'monogermtubi']